jgi:hypothetical protein
MTQTDCCRMAVYDYGGNLLGYKTDSFWVLSINPKFAKIHPSKDCGLEGHLVSNLIYLSNNSSRTIARLFERGGKSDDCVVVNVERVEADGTINEVIAKYQVMKDSTGKYIATSCSD